MENQKDYKVMTPDEQMAWLTDFAHWSNEKLPVLCALGNAWEIGTHQVDGRGIETDFSLFVLSGFRAEVVVVP